MKEQIEIIVEVAEVVQWLNEMYEVLNAEQIELLRGYLNRAADYKRN